MPSVNELKKQPRCPYGNQAKYFCINPQCRRPGIICEKAQLSQSQCWLFHQNCNKAKWSEIQSFARENIHTKTGQFINLQQRIQTIFIKTLQKIQFQHQKFKIWTKTFGHNLQSMKFIKILIDKNYDQLTGEYMSNMIPTLLNKQSKRIQTPIIAQTDLLFIRAEIDRTLQKISGLYLKMKKIDKNNNNAGQQQSDSLIMSSAAMKAFSPYNHMNNYQLSSIQFKSKIVDNFNIIQTFFDSRKVKSTGLVYRASENNFSIKRFHEVCNNIPDTLTLIHNQYGKKFGGYTPVAWTYDKKHWVADKSLRSFIYSLDMNEKFKLNLAQFAIASNPERGPTFGCCDICIVDNGNKVQSNCEFPISYNNNGKYIRSQSTSTLFTGHHKGQFLIREWEVYKLEFQ